jgi:hypothetical protein
MEPGVNIPESDVTIINRFATTSLELLRLKMTMAREKELTTRMRW